MRLLRRDWLCFEAAARGGYSYGSAPIGVIGRPVGSAVRVDSTTTMRTAPEYTAAALISMFPVRSGVTDRTRHGGGRGLLTRPPGRNRSGWCSAWWREG